MSSLDQKVHGDIQLLTPRKDLMGGNETKELSDCIAEIVAKGEPKIVVDLGKVSFLNSTASHVDPSPNASSPLGPSAASPAS